MSTHRLDLKPTRLAWIGAFAGVFYACAGGALATVSGALTLVPAFLAGIVLALLGFVTAGNFYFTRRETLEQQNLEAFRREHPGTELFEDSDEALKLARRAQRYYRRFAIPVAVFLIGAGAVVVSVWLWRAWSSSPQLQVVAQPLQFGVLALALFIGAMIGGAYYVGASREPDQRWLRPIGAWLLFTGLLYLVGGLSLLFQLWGFKASVFQLNIARVELFFIMALGAELMVSTVIEFYRPRTVAEERPLYESRLLALFTEPGGIARNVAVALDYQFGFEVSEARFYRFFERTLVPFVILMVIFFWLLTSIIVIRPEEQGIRERFGAVVSKTPLTAGLYFKLPWPLARIYRFPVARVQEITVGYVPAGEADAELDDSVITWDKQHNKEETDYLIPNPHAEKDYTPVKVQDVGNVPVTTSLMSASIPLYYKVHNLYDYRYRHRDSKSLIEQITMREIVKYLAGVDIFDILTRERGVGGRILKERIQSAVDDLQVGIDVVFVGLEGLHPPVEVGDSFHMVVAASEKKQTELLKAEQYAIGRKPESEAEALDIVTRAKTYSYDKRRIAQAEIQRFEKQLQAYKKEPQLFMTRQYLDVLEQEITDIRKYIMASGYENEVLVLDLKEKLRADLLDIDLGETQKAKPEAEK
ncbi:MAG: SPFH domain-containing protein [Lentisphaeria bacterium]